jgi:hypothetical protein
MSDPTEHNLNHQYSILGTKGPFAIPRRAYCRRAIELRHPTGIPPGVQTTVCGILPKELAAFRPDRFRFAVAEIDDWIVSDFRIHGISQVIRESTVTAGDDLPGRIAAFLRAEFAHIEGCECVRLKLFVTRPTYARGLIKVWDRNDVSEAFDDDRGGAPTCDPGGIAVEILQTAKNFAESFDEESCCFEVHTWQRLGGQSKISFRIPASLDDFQNPARPPHLHPQNLVESLVDGGCATIQTQMTFEMDVAYLGSGIDVVFCCYLSGPCVPSASTTGLALRGGRCIPLPMPSYTSVERLTRATISTPIDRPIELVDLIVRDAADWVVSDVYVDGVSWLPWRLGTAEKLAECMRADALWILSGQDESPRVIPKDSSVSMSVLYVGAQESATFWGCLVGRAPIGEDGTPARGDQTMTIPVRQGRPSHEGSMLVAEHLAGPPLLVESIVVVSPDWVVHDLRIDGRSAFAKTGDIIGEALGEMAQLGMHLGIAREKIELLVSYVGEAEADAAFQCTIHGSSPSASRSRHESAREESAGFGWDPWLE